jgi:hypothetical protein
VSKFKKDKSGKVKHAPDGTPYPWYFDQCEGGNPSRTAWLYYHTPKDQREETGRDVKFRLYDYLCHGVGESEDICFRLPHRKLGPNLYCPKCLPYTERDRQIDEERKKKFDEWFADTPEAIARREAKYAEEDAKQQRRMEREKQREEKAREERMAARKGTLLDVFRAAGGKKQ